MAPPRLSRPARGLEALPHLPRKTKFPQVSLLAGTNPQFSERLSIRALAWSYRVRDEKRIVGCSGCYLFLVVRSWLCLTVVEANSHDPSEVLPKFGALSR